MPGGFCKNLHDLKRLGVREWLGRILWWRNWPGLAGRRGVGRIQLTLRFLV